MEKLNIIIEWIKENWIIVLIVLLLTSSNVFAFWRVDNTKKLLELAEETHQKQIRFLQEENARLKIEQDKIQEEYLTTIKVIESKYQKAIIANKMLRKQKVQTYKKQFINQPRKLADEIKKVWGFDEVIVEK